MYAILLTQYNVVLIGKQQYCYEKCIVYKIIINEVGFIKIVLLMQYLNFFQSNVSRYRKKRLKKKSINNRVLNLYVM